MAQAEPESDADWNTPQEAAPVILQIVKSRSRIGPWLAQAIRDKRVPARYVDLDPPDMSVEAFWNEGALPVIDLDDAKATKPGVLNTRGPTLAPYPFTIYGLEVLRSAIEQQLPAKIAPVPPVETTLPVEVAARQRAPSRQQRIGLAILRRLFPPQSPDEEFAAPDDVSTQAVKDRLADEWSAECDRQHLPVEHRPSAPSWQTVNRLLDRERS